MGDRLLKKSGSRESKADSLVSLGVGHYTA
jgi:hypothetical protein